MKYAEVLLPLPLYSVYTYSYDENLPSSLQVGSRVLVQFGRKKYYTAIVVRVNAEKPKDYEVKPIMSILDAEPIIRYPQLKLWDWIAEYYLCSPGEVYKCAVPAGLKIESETFVALNSDYEEDTKNRLTDRESIIVQCIQDKGKIKVSEIENETKIKNVAQAVSALMKKGAVEISERIVEKYKPKTETMVRLCADREDQDKIHSFFESVSRSRQQEKTLVALLDRSHWLNLREEIIEVSKSQLQEAAGVSSGILKALETKGIIEFYKKTINRFSQGDDKAAPIRLSPLSEQQTRVFKEIVDSFKERQVTLLRGVTGSGKTEIYTHLINQVLNEGNQVLFLVPEISLTTQLTDRLRKVFGDRLIVYHSKFSDNERVDIWNKILHSHEPLIILGARSSVFLPFAHLGLVVVDEEHESSYKQYDPAPRYNARDVAIMLASMHGAKALLGSATPSIETYWKAKTGKFGETEIEERFKGAVLPEVRIIDMKAARKKRKVKGIMSFELITETRRTLKDGWQSIMFQNRRGFAPMVICKECGWTPKCPNCDISLVYHKRAGELKCHYCGHTEPLPQLCPACGLNGIEIYGYGTERIAEDLHKEFDGYAVARMDLDTTRNKDAYQELIENFSNLETDILVGTQMVSKGLDFEKVKTVGVLNADTLLNFPDFRSDERAFNMLEQVAGRAGRREEKGLVLIQTNESDNKVLEFVRNHDYKGFYHHEIEERKRYGYPPFTKVINIYIKNKNDVTVDKAALILTHALRNVLGNRVFGPEKPLVSRIALYYFQSIMLKVESGVSMRKVKQLLRDIYSGIAHFPEIKSSIIYYDVDPA